MIQKVFIPIIVRIYIAMGIVLYTIQKIRMSIRKMRTGNEAGVSY